RRFREFDLRNKVFAITGGGRGLSLALAEALDTEFGAARKRADLDFGGSLHFQRIDVRDVENVNNTRVGIATQRNRLDGLIATAGVNHVGSATEHSPANITDMMSINYMGVFTAVTASAKQMLQWKCRSSIVLVSSISGV
ncbi:NAD(P)-binding protein, partial [Cadophora sp. DSE1049]